MTLIFSDPILLNNRYKKEQKHLLYASKWKYNVKKNKNFRYLIKLFHSHIHVFCVAIQRTAVFTFSFITNSLN